MSSFQELVDAYKNNAWDLLLKAAKLEVRAHVNKLQCIALDTLIKVTTNLVIEDYMWDKSENLEHFYNERQCAFKFACHYIGNANTAIHIGRYFEPLASCNASIDKIVNFKSVDNTDFSTIANPEDKQVATKVWTVLAELFPNITIAKEQELMHQINAKQALFNEKKVSKMLKKKQPNNKIRDPIIHHSQLKAAVTKMFDKQFKSKQTATQKTIWWTPKARFQVPQRMVQIQTGL